MCNGSFLHPIPLKVMSISVKSTCEKSIVSLKRLYVPNYRRPEVRRYAFERSGAEFIMAVPGPADTSVGSRIFFALNWR